MTLLQKYSLFLQQHHKEPLYAEAEICWLNTGETASPCIFKLSSDYDEEEDKQIFFYVDSIEKFQSLTQPCGEDFIILEDTVSFLEGI